MSAKRKLLIKKADKAVSDWVRAFSGRCVICGSVERLQCGHLFSRVAYSTRWDERNIYCQCAGCNLRHEHDPYPLMRYAESVWGREEIDDLYRKFRSPVKQTEEDLVNIIEEYRKKLSYLE